MYLNKELIKESISLFGYLIPEGKRIDNYTFMKLIKDNYSLLNPISYKMYSYISKLANVYYMRSNDKIRVFKI